MSDGERGSTLKVLNPDGGSIAILAEAGPGTDTGAKDVGAVELVTGESPRLRLRELPRPDGGGGILCWRRMCLASASERVKDLSHSGRAHVNGFSPVCDRI